MNGDPLLWNWPGLADIGEASRLHEEVARQCVKGIDSHRSCGDCSNRRCLANRECDESGGCHVREGLMNY